MGWCTLDSVLKDILDENDDDEINSADFLHIRQDILGTRTNSKTISGTLTINTQNPKDNIVVKKGSTQVVSIGAGGINTNLLVADIICCGTAGSTVSSSAGIVIDSTQSTIDIVSGGSLAVQISSSGVDTSSDRRMKDNINELEDNYINLLSDIKPISFNYKEETDRHFGFIAQEVEEALNKYNLENNVTKINDNGMYMLNYTEMIPVVWKIIQNLQERITALEGE